MNADDVRRLTEAISPNMERGACVLFLGAGFSVEALDQDGNAIPAGDRLRRELWRIVYGDSPVDASTLGEVYETAVRRNATRVIELLKKRLQASTLPDFYLSFFRLPWRRIYTTNIDTLGEFARDRFALPVELQVLTPKDGPPLTSPHERIGRPPVQYIQLNGSVGGLPDGVTFSPGQYARDLALPPLWQAAYPYDIRDATVVFVGTELNEPTLDQALTLRDLRDKNSPRENRRPSFLVTRDRPPRARFDNLTRQNIHWIEGTARELSEQVLANIAPAVPRASATRSIQDHLVSRLRAAAAATRPSGIYFSGSEPGWADIEHRLVALRSVTSELVEFSVAAIAGPLAQVGCIVGTSGSGKTTVLMDSLARLDAMGKNCLYIGRTSDIGYQDVISQLASARLDVIGIEESRTYASDVKRLLSLAVSEGSPRVVLLSMAAHRIERLFTPEERKALRFREFPTHILTDADIAALLGVLEANDRLGYLRPMSADARRASFRKQREIGRQLLVAMIRLTEHRSLKRKVVDEYDDLTEPEKHIYGLLTPATAHGRGLTEIELLMALEGADVAHRDALGRMTDRGLITHAGNRYLLRHGVVAQSLEPALAVGGHLSKVIAALLPVLVLRDAEGDRPAHDLMVHLMGHNYLLEVLGLVRTQELLSTLEPAMRGSHHFWLQRAEVEIEAGEPGMALVYLQNAKALEPHDFYVDVGIQHARLRVSAQSAGSAEAIEQARTALNELERIVADRPGSPHPAHVYGAQVMALSERLPKSESMVEILRKALRLTDAACSRFEGNPRFPDMKRRLERALMMQIVKEE